MMMVVAERERTVNDEAAVIVLDATCYVNSRSGELVRAVRVGDDVYIADEYGHSFWMDAEHFAVIYELCAVCPAAA